MQCDAPSLLLVCKTMVSVWYKLRTEDSPCLPQRALHPGLCRAQFPVPVLCRARACRSVMELAQVIAVSIEQHVEHVTS